jgi:hypothetical protein
MYCCAPVKFNFISFSFFFLLLYFLSLFFCCKLQLNFHFPFLLRPANVCLWFNFSNKLKNASACLTDKLCEKNQLVCTVSGVALFVIIIGFIPSIFSKVSFGSLYFEKLEST